MSTSLRGAYRVPIEKLHQFEKDTTDQIVENTADYLCDLLEALEPEEFADWIENNGTIQPEKSYNKKAYRRFLVIKGLEFLEYKKENDPVGREFAFEHGWEVYLDEHFAYVLPRGFTCDEVPEYAEDYSYWDTTDKDEDVSRGEWVERGEKWEELLERGGSHSAPLKIAPITFATRDEKYDSFEKLHRKLFDKVDDEKAEQIVDNVYKVLNR